MEKVTRIEVTWAGLLNPIILILTAGTTANARRYAREELGRMAEAADLYNESVKSGLDPVGGYSDTMNQLNKEIRDGKHGDAMQKMLEKENSS